MEAKISTDFIKTVSNINTSEFKSIYKKIEAMLKPLNQIPNFKIPKLQMFGSITKDTLLIGSSDINVMIMCKVDPKKEQFFDNYNELYPLSTYIPLPQLMMEDDTINPKSMYNLIHSKLQDNAKQLEIDEIIPTFPSIKIKFKDVKIIVDFSPTIMFKSKHLKKTVYATPYNDNTYKFVDPYPDRHSFDLIAPKLRKQAKTQVLLLKYWAALYLPHLKISYLLESMVINYYVSSSTSLIFTKLNDAERFFTIISHVSKAIFHPILDTKEIENDINFLNDYQKSQILEQISNTVNTMNELESTCQTKKQFEEEFFYVILQFSL